MVVGVVSESAVPKWARKVIDDRQDDKPLVDEALRVETLACAGWYDDGGRQAGGVDGQESPSSEGCCTRTARPPGV